MEAGTADGHGKLGGDGWEVDDWGFLGGGGVWFGETKEAEGLSFVARAPKPLDGTFGTQREESGGWPVQSRLM